jgi:hypothetical protein
LWQQVQAHCHSHLAASELAPWSLHRLAVLVTALLSAQTTVLAKLAAEVVALGLTATRQPDCAARGLRRTLTDTALTDPGAYQASVRAVVDWEALRRTGRPVLLIMDESSRGDQIHLLRLGLAYRGGSVPVAWALWRQNVPLPAGQYWEQVEAVLTQARRVVPADLAVVVTADRAYDVPAFVDRVGALGWHWVVRAKARSALRYRPHQGPVRPLAQILHRTVAHPGQRWKGRGAVFKKAGWRPASVVAHWAPGEHEPVVVLTDLPPRWAVLALYDRRFWIEPSFRSDKRHGWDWEASGIQGVPHHTALVLAMAWATLVATCVGAAEATLRLARLRARPWHTRRAGWDGRVVEHARHSLLTMGLRLVRRWLLSSAPPLPWHLDTPDARSWNDCWQQAQIARNLAHAVRP